MEKYSNNECERNFGHICISWEIENFCFETRKSNCLIFSREIFVEKPHLIKWLMKLRTKPKGELNLFSLNLESLEFEAENKTFWVDLKLSFLDNKGEKCDTIWFSNKFVKNVSHEIELWNLDYVKSKVCFVPLEFCTFSIFCQMIIHFDDSYKADKTDLHLRNLSLDILNLFRNGTHSDVILKTTSRDFTVHKVICAQSSVLAELMEGNDVVNLSSFDTEAMFYILSYLYSGNIFYVNIIPSILIYDCALYLNLCDVLDYYHPEELSIKLVFDVQQHSFLWFVNFNNFNESYHCSPLFKTELMDAVWKLYLDTNSNDGYVSLFAEIVSGTVPDNCCLVFSVMTKKNYSFKKMQLLKFTEKRFGYEQFLTKQYLHEILDLTSNTLKIIFTVEIHSNQIASTEKYALSCTHYSEQKRCSLSQNLILLFKNEGFTDLIIEADGTVFKVHKCILAARSSVFNAMLKELRDSKLVLMFNSKVLFVTLSYIYGDDVDFNQCDIMEVYQTAVYLSVTSLKERCFEILVENFSNMSTHEVLHVLILASDAEDIDLKKSVLKFLYRNKDKLIESYSWSILSVTNPKLFSKVTELLTSK